MKRLGSFLLALALACSSIPHAAAASHGGNGKNQLSKPRRTIVDLDRTFASTKNEIEVRIPRRSNEIFKMNVSSYEIVIPKKLFGSYPPEVPLKEADGHLTLTSNPGQDHEYTVFLRHKKSDEIRSLVFYREDLQ